MLYTQYIAYIIVSVFSGAAWRRDLLYWWWRNTDLTQLHLSFVSFLPILLTSPVMNNITGALYSVTPSPHH